MSCSNDKEAPETAAKDATCTSAQRILDTTLTSITDGVIITDADERIVCFNPVAEELTGRKSQQVLGRSLDETLNLMSERGGQRLSGRIAAVLADQVGSDQPGSGWLLVGEGGAQFPVELFVTRIDAGAPADDGWVVVFRDISHSRRMSAQLFWQANHDPLTGLENRHRFERRLQHLISSSERGKKPHALLYLDLDQFKIVNDTCGHAAGDELLRQLANMFRRKMRRSDILARLGGDEFGVLLENCPLDSARRVAGELQQLVKGFRFAWDGKRFGVGISIGLVPFDESTKTAASVLIAADTACFAAKDSGRNRVHVFCHENSEAARRHGEIQWVSHIQSALDQERLVLYSQLVVPLGPVDSHPPHREVLLRMLTVEGELIPPGAFIPAAERYNMMPALDRWVVRSAFKYLQRMQAQEQTQDCILNINLSGGSLAEEGFLDFVQTQLREQGVAPEKICFEVTETSAIANMDKAVEFIAALRHLGCKFALDDFGSGLSSFGYLKQLPVDFLKIDGSFIKDILHDPVNCAMVEAIHQVGKIMGIQTVAEFVEDANTMARLRELGIDYAQGYHIEKPGPLH